MLDPQVTARIDDLSKAQLLKLVPDFLHRIVVHYALWFTEVRHQMGMPKALEMLEAVFEKNLGIQMGRLGETLGFEVVDGLPAALTQLDKPALLKLIDAIAKNWLANDGVWFQAVEFSHGMTDAKRCNDSCWAHFSPFEAWSAKRLLGLGEKPGLEGLAQALNLRVYAHLNTQSLFFEDEHTLIFQMNVCRVQAARQRKGLADYPCKSGGLVEYTYFARSIDSRIVTECIGCPPDPHPAEWFCAWRFKIS
jgi:hypothetical protein